MFLSSNQCFNILKYIMEIHCFIQGFREVVMVEKLCNDGLESLGDEVSKNL